jgi:predicted acyltransferase
MLDLKGIKPWGYAVMMAFGVNAVTAYVLHEVASVALLSPPVRWLYDAAAHVLPPDAAALLPTAAFTTLVWAPIAYLYRRRWVVKI